MPELGFVIGALSALAAIAMLFPWLRNANRLNALLGNRATSPAAASLLIAAILGLYYERDNARPATHSAPAEQGGEFTSAVKIFADAGGKSAENSGTAPRPASSMESATANLEVRLAKGGGSADDWELLAKSFEFLGRPADAAAARAHQLPNKPAAASLPPAGVSISGEVAIAPGLSAKAAAGETLFIVAKSRDSPGPPVAVIRAAVSTWPVKFTLDDSQSMLPGRNLSSASRITVEARVSLKGQPLPTSGDLQGSSSEINPADGRPLKILIDRVIP
jgi:hypothetical protein